MESEDLQQTTNVIMSRASEMSTQKYFVAKPAIFLFHNLHSQLSLLIKKQLNSTKKKVPRRPGTINRQHTNFEEVNSCFLGLKFSLTSIIDCWAKPPSSSLSPALSQCVWLDENSKQLFFPLRLCRNISLELFFFALLQHSLCETEQRTWRSRKTIINVDEEI